MSSPDVDGETRRRSRRWGFLLLAAYAAASIVAGLLLHRIKAVGIENDDYVGMAQALLAGSLPRDPYRPMLYPLAVAAVGSVVGDCFVAAKIVSALGATALVWATYALTRRCCSRRHAWLAAVLVALNGHVVVFGMQASTDMLFTALVAVALVAAVHAWQRPALGRFVWLGAACGLAYFSRYQAILLALPAVIACRGESPAPWRELAKRGACVLAGAFVALVPHGLLMRAVFGTWFHDENWRTVEVKYFRDGAVAHIDATDAGSVAAVLLREPGAVLRRAFADLGTCLADVLPAMVQGCSPRTAVGVVLALAAVAGLAVALRRRWFPLALPLSYAVPSALAVCLLFVPVPRVLLGTIPLAAVGLAVVAVGAAARSASVGTVAAALLVAAGAVHTVGAVQQLRAMEPWGEVRAAQRLRTECAMPFTVLCTHGHLTALEPMCALVQAPAAGDDPVAWCEDVVRTADRLGAAFVLVGRLSCGAAFERLAASSHPRLCVRERDPDVLLWEVRGVQLEWVAATVVETQPGRDSVVRVTLRDDVPLDDVAVVGVRVRANAGEPAYVQLSPAAARTYEAVLPGSASRAAAGSGGVWTFEPVVGSKAGRFGGGAPFVFRGP